MSAIANALKKAEEVKRKGNGGNGSRLPDLSQFKIQEKTPEQIAADAEEAKRKDEWCRSAALILLKIRKRINEIKLVAFHGPLSKELAKEIEDLQNKEQALVEAGGDSTLAAHLDFSVLLEQIRTAPQTSDNAELILKEVVQRGRYSLLSEEEAEKRKKEWGNKVPTGVQFFFGKVYVPFHPAEGEVKSKGQMALESVLGQYLYSVRKSRAAQINAEISKIKAEGRPALSFFKQGDIGEYVLYFPKRVDDSGRQWQEGAGLISLRKEKQRDGLEVNVIRVLDGAGSLKWLRGFKNQWIPFGWYKNGIPNHIGDESYEFAERLLKTIRAAMAAYYAQK
ncbi:MAG: hypothetical protein HY773_02890 [Candidatus Terrybacteria bacterium]|nr:hypothetical protein [Candidatus Terrybacteria bacterium]